MDRSRYVGVVQVALPSEGKGHAFESRRVRQFLFIFQRDTRVQIKNRILSCSSE